MEMMMVVLYQVGAGPTYCEETLQKKTGFIHMHSFKNQASTAALRHMQKTCADINRLIPVNISRPLRPPGPLHLQWDGVFSQDRRQSATMRHRMHAQSCKHSYILVCPTRPAWVFLEMDAKTVWYFKQHTESTKAFTNIRFPLRGEYKFLNLTNGIIGWDEKG